MRPLLVHLVLVRRQAFGAEATAVAEAVEGLDRPLIEALERHPATPCAMVLPGHLLEWLDVSDSGLLDRLADGVRDERLELIGGGFYSPMLSILPWRDAIGQQEMMAGYLERRTGTRPRGAWLEGCVWEPRLAEVLADGGARYTLLEDQQLLAAGVPPPLSDSYVTEHVGRPLAILPMDGALSALATGPVEALIEGLRAAQASGRQGVTLAVDVHQLASGDGVQARADALLTGLAGAQQWLRLGLPAQTLTEAAGRPRVYLPSSSGQRSGSGLWQRWLAADSLADRMHKRMIEVSRRFAALERVVRNQGWRAMSRLTRPRRALYRGQYGHAWVGGPDGGLHDPAVRDAAFRSLIDAEVAADQQVRGESDYLEVSLRDLYADLETEVLLRNQHLRAVIRPALGCFLAEFEHLPSRTALLNVVDRPPSELVEDGVSGGHRGCLHDRFLAVDAPMDRWLDGSGELSDLFTARHRLVSLDSEGRGPEERARISFVGEGVVRCGDVMLSATLIKEVAVGARGDGLELQMRLDLSEPLPQALDWCVEFNLHPAADGGDVELLVSGHAEADASPRCRERSPHCSGFTLFAPARGYGVAVRSDTVVVLERAPLMTHALGSEAIWQGTALLLRRTLEAGQGGWAWGLRLGFSVDD